MARTWNDRVNDPVKTAQGGDTISNGKFVIGGQPDEGKEWRHWEEGDNSGFQLKDIPIPTPAPVTEAPPEWSPSPGNSANEAAGDVPDNFWSHDSSKSFWDNIKGSPDAPDTAPGTAPGVSNSFNTNTNQSLNQNVTTDDNFIINNAGGNGRKRRSFNKLGANDFLQNFMGKTFSKNFNSGLFN